MRDEKITILLVEDDEIDAMNVQRAFKKVNIVNPVLVASNGLEALAMLRGEGVPKLNPTPKLILLDLNMPRMNGVEFLKELRADPELRPISVIVLTTSNDERDKVASYNFNVAGYVVKPVEPELFIKAMATLNMYWTLMELPGSTP